MSQEKVDQYKQSKKNRKEEIAKQKRNAKMRQIAVWVVIGLLLAGLVFGIVITIVNQRKKQAADESAQADMYQESNFLLQDFADIQGNETEAETEPAEESAQETAEE